MKINFNCLKLTKNITKKNMISNVSKQMIKRNTNNKVLPLVTFPLVAYYIGGSKDKALERLIKKMEDAGVDIPSNYKPDPNTNSGLDFVSQGKFRSAINDAAKNGTIDSSEKQDLLHSVAFTGKDDSDYSVYDGNNDDGCCDCDSDDDCCDSDSGCDSDDDCCDSDSDCDSGDAAVSSC